MNCIHSLNQTEEFLCQSCDETFYFAGTDEVVCPKCGAKGAQWIVRLSELNEDEEQAERAE